MISVLERTSVRVALVLAAAAGIGALVWWHGPAWGAVGDAFRFVRWELVAAAIGLNLLSVVVRAVAWKTVIDQAMPPPHPTALQTFSAFGVGLFANAVLPGRVGELARVAVLTRKLPNRDGAWATLLGTVFAHRVFDLLAALALVAYVLATARLPRWAGTSLSLLAALGGVLLLVALVIARRHHRSVLDGLGPVRRMVEMARHGLGVMHAPLPALVAVLCQCLGWLCQLLAVYVAMRAFNIGAPMPAAALVLVLMNLATLFPLWPGNVGLVQAAIALPLVGYGVAKSKGIAFGFGLQAIEASVGVGVGLLFLAREGLTFAMLKVMPTASAAEVPDEQRGGEEPREAVEPERPRARVPG